MVDDDDPVKDAAREIAAAARAVATGVKKRDRPQEVQPHEVEAALAERRRREGMVDDDDPVKDAAREIAAAARAVATGVKKRDRPQEVQPHEVEAALAERRQREADRDRFGLHFRPAD
jgi:uncharacterized protein with ATP-grasp and redox domains